MTKNPSYQAGQSATNRMKFMNAALFGDLKAAYLRRERVDAQGNPTTVFNIPNNLGQNTGHPDTGRGNTWESALSALFDKVAWNVYISKVPLVGEQQDTRENLSFRNIPPVRTIQEQLFVPDKQEWEYVEDLLMKWVACRVWNLNNTAGVHEHGWIECNMKEWWAKDENELAQAYSDLHKKWTDKFGEGTRFPVDYQERLNQHQWWGLHNYYDTVLGMIRKASDPKDVPYQPIIGGTAKRATTSHTFSPPSSSSRSSSSDSWTTRASASQASSRGVSTSSSRQPSRMGVSHSLSPGRDTSAELYSVNSPRASRPRRRSLSRLSEGPDEEEAQIMEEGDGYGDVNPFEPADLVQQVVQMEGLGGQFDAPPPPGFRPFGAPVAQHKFKTSADVVHVGDTAVVAMHLLQTDHDVQPVMGAVHMVRPAASFSDKHFMHDIEGDINEGQRVMIEKSRRGPFRDQSGQSTVLDSSAHVTYRNRSGIMEITVRRGAVRQEFQQLLNKLQMHRLSAWGSYVTLIKGTKRFRLGRLTDINLSYLQSLIEECTDQYGNCGIEIAESGSKAGAGALYKGGVHGSRFKSKTRRGKGIYNASVKE